MNTHCQDQRDSVAQIREGISHVRLAQDKETTSEFKREAEACIRSLYLSDYATKLDDIPTREPETCTWVLGHRKYQEWLSLDSHSLLWLSGNPGCGKTVISSFLIETLRAQLHSERIVAYFICDNKDMHFRTKEAILRFLLHQIMVANQSLARHAVDHYKHMENSMASSAATLWGIFENIIRDQQRPDIYCILDALDECEDDSRQWMLTKLNSLFGKSQRRPRNFRMIVTSRPWEDIEYGFQLACRIRLKTEMEEGVKNDIATFVDSQVQKLARHRGYTAELEQHVYKVLVKNANDMFLWVSLIIDSLEKTPVRFVSKVLQEVPRSIYELYARILQRVPSIASERIKSILTWVLLAIEPLSLEELGIACEIDYVDELKQVRKAGVMQSIEADIKLSGPILKIHRGRVYLVHQSAKDFLISEQVQPGIENYGKEYLINEAESHSKLAATCLKYLSFDEFRTGPLPISDNVVRNQSRLFKAHLRKHMFLKYSAKYWADHFRFSQDCSIETLQKSYSLFKSTQQCFRLVSNSP